eukprot:TRINITY_DN1756_c0_g1_i7.p2 TRINITY_DN1756_c0_g1~~TRINITY_DN1756_c0_g1_i7.p2  ORF type:complete len:210 (-),score=50.21 TRINITY_DN1756_c0_g1_i7:132-761(-)
MRATTFRSCKHFPAKMIRVTRDKERIRHQAQRLKMEKAQGKEKVQATVSRRNPNNEEVMQSVVAGKKVRGKVLRGGLKTKRAQERAIMAKEKEKVQEKAMRWVGAKKRAGKVRAKEKLTGRKKEKIQNKGAKNIGKVVGKAPHHDKNAEKKEKVMGRKQKTGKVQEMVMLWVGAAEGTARRRIRGRCCWEREKGTEGEGRDTSSEGGVG